MSQTFALHPIPPRARLWLNGCVLYLLAQAAVIFWLVPPQPIARAIVGVATAGTIGLILLFRHLSTAGAVRIEDDRLILRLPLYGRELPLRRIVRESIRTVAPDTDPTYRMTLRTNGLAVPGYRLGWFRTAGAGRTLVAQTDKAALAFQTQDGYAVVLSVTDPAGLARAIGQPVS